jgi:hypothetical protein
VKVYEHFLNRLIGPMIGAADDDDADPMFVIRGDDPHRNEKVRAVFELKFLPLVRTWFPAEFENETKLALAYLLTFDRARAERIWDAALPVGHPTDPPILLWEWF